MESAQRIVADIVARCKFRDVEVSETLAAFAARMVVHKSKRRLVLEREMSPEDEQYLVAQCERVLVQTREPALETIKMQLEFDFAYANLEEELRAKRERKDKAVASLQRSIAQLVPQKASDFETLTTLYRQIFTLLMLDANATEKPVDRVVEKEVAAALESVFPRVGLKSFISMSADDKRFQLEELMRIVEGIRLFNKELGKGGAGISVSVDFVQENVSTLATSVKGEVKECNEVCSQYTEVLLHVHHKNFPSDHSSPDFAIIQRWQDELSNRRQFLSYLQSLDEDISFALEKITTMLTRFKSDLNALKNLVGARTSLPKSQVYPLFEAVSRSWKELLDEHELLQVRSRSLKALMQFKDSFDRTLNDDSDFVRIARKSATIPAEELFQQVETFPTEDKLNGRPMGASLPSFRGKNSFGDDLDDEFEDAAGALEQSGVAIPLRMPVDSTPEFMQLPLEYQGFCPWTVVERGGLLLPGDPSLGVVQYRDAYHVFVNERALGEFMVHPRRYVQGILKVAARQPSLIYLLRLQDSFPSTNLSSLLKICREFRVGLSGSSASGGVHPLLAPPASQKVDASTSTPVHFVEKLVDYNYEWNEWSLRRKAIKIANLRHCKTVSCQTRLSAFRRETDTQVYLPAEHATQTAKERGTNPARTVTYFAGLRSGNVATGPDTVDDRKHADDDDGANDNQSRPAVIAYTFEL